MLSPLRVAWRRELHGSLRLTAHSGRLLVGERHAHVVRLDPMSGELRWDARADTFIGAIAFDDEVAVCRSQSGGLHAVRLKDGESLWRQQTPGATSDFVSVGASSVVTGGWRGYHRMQGHSLTDGQVRWTARRADLGGVQLRPLMTRKGMYGSRFESRIAWLMDPDSGELIARWSLPEPVAASPEGPTPFVPTVDGRVLVRCGRRRIAACSPDGRVEQLWQHDCDLSITAPAPVGGRLWASAPAGVVVVDVDAHRSQVTPTSNPIVVVFPDGGGAFAVDAAGLVYYLDADAKVLHRTALPRRTDDFSSAAAGMVHVRSKGWLWALRLP